MQTVDHKNAARKELLGRKKNPGKKMTKRGRGRSDYYVKKIRDDGEPEKGDAVTTEEG